MTKTIVLLLISNLFMTFAWYGHLKHFRAYPLIAVILISWGIAFAEYCFQVPANRIGHRYFTLPQLKILQEVITLAVFAVFAVVYMREPVTRNFLFAGLCLLGAVFFIFRDQKPAGELPGAGAPTAVSAPAADPAPGAMSPVTAEPSSAEVSRT